MSTRETKSLLDQAQASIAQMYRDQEQILRDQLRIDQMYLEAKKQAERARQYADPAWMEREARRQAKAELERSGQFEVARLIEEA